MSKKLSDIEKGTNYETMRHIMQVQKLLNSIVVLLLERGEKHDLSKLEDPELELFTEYTPKLQGITYGSDEYRKCLDGMGPALVHHYAKNRHHPEHFKNGVNDMTLIDLMEMLCDWKASTLRHDDGNINKSLEYNGTRFGIDPQLLKILENTVDLFE